MWIRAQTKIFRENSVKIQFLDFSKECNLSFNLVCSIIFEVKEINYGENFRENTKPQIFVLHSQRKIYVHSCVWFKIYLLSGVSKVLFRYIYI